jgi:predicted DNA-binding transcriptional regulator YafY
MDRLQRIYKLHQILKSHRLPVPHRRLQERLECSRATVNRIIQEMRLYFDAPIEYDREANGYRYADRDGQSFELPGLWFSAGELHALVTVQQLLAETQPGLLDHLLTPLRGKIEKILASASPGGLGELGKRVRILRMAARAGGGGHFQLVADALLARKRLAIRYFGRERNAESERVVSPQRLVHYRDNWYLDAWCHQREALRSFAVERIRAVKALEERAQDIPDDELDAHFASGYGIFAGNPKHVAVLRFSPERARWVADERWHPRQEGGFLEDGRYELRLPYSDPRELVMDILRHGPEVEVVGPEELRQLLRGCLEAALARYRRPKPNP